MNRNSISRAFLLIIGFALVLYANSRNAAVRLCNFRILRARNRSQHSYSAAVRRAVPLTCSTNSLTRCRSFTNLATREPGKGSSGLLFVVVFRVMVRLPDGRKDESASS